MARTITVKGVGKACVKPDQVEIRMTLESMDKTYEAAMALAARRIDQMEQALVKAGFAAGSLKTTRFDIRAEYESVKDKNHNYVRVFQGYACNHALKLAFDFDTEHLAAALGAVAASRVDPMLYIDFTVKNPAAVNEMILQDAAENARQKAQLLCAASGVKLGELVRIDYNWGEVAYISSTKFTVDDCVADCAPDIRMDPDDIEAGDTVTFVWEID